MSNKTVFRSVVSSFIRHLNDDPRRSGRKIEYLRSDFKCDVNPLSLRT